MKYFLVVIFLIDGEPSVLDGWLPRSYESRDHCLLRKDFIKNSLLERAGNFEKVKDVSCVLAKDDVHAVSIAKDEIL